jgi:hypothetical protein
VVPGHGATQALRLLRIDSSMTSTELWRLRSDMLPDRVFLTVSWEGERILAITTGDDSEVVTLDASGRPIASFSLDGRLDAAPIATSAGFSVPLRGWHLGGPPVANVLDLKLVTRNQASPGLCGTRWLHARVDEKNSSVLGDTHQCRKNGGDGH